MKVDGLPVDSRLPARREYNLDKFEQQCLDVCDSYPSEKLHDIFDSKQCICQAILDAEPCPTAATKVTKQRQKSDDFFIENNFW